MGYYEVSLLAADGDFITRTAACAALEGMPHPDHWAADHNWEMAAQPGFGPKYTYALATEVPRPGKDPTVISDADILAAVQQIIASESTGG